MDKYKLIKNKIKNQIPNNWHITILNKKRFTSSTINKIKTMKLNQKTSYKPRGLWISELNDGWLKWCSENMPKWIDPKYNYYYKIKIDKSNLLLLDTKKKIKSFYDKYKGNITGTINWKLIEKKYNGIIFKPFFKFSINDKKYIWYMLLDCNSICIWNSYSIINMEKIIF